MSTVLFDIREIRYIVLGKYPTVSMVDFLKMIECLIYGWLRDLDGENYFLATEKIELELNLYPNGQYLHSVADEKVINDYFLAYCLTAQLLWNHFCLFGIDKEVRDSKEFLYTVSKIDENHLLIQHL